MLTTASATVTHALSRRSGRYTRGVHAWLASRSVPSAPGAEAGATVGAAGFAVAAGPEESSAEVVPARSDAVSAFPMPHRA
jgi:hypothetical protein